MSYGAVRRHAVQFFSVLVYRGSFPAAKALLVVVWFFILWIGEKHAFESSTSSCHWDKWENWPADAIPHHLVLLADPQLVDPHTYPGRPWPLDRLTVLHTDQYLTRGFQSLQENLDPDSIIFLGDLFDGGREWWTGRGSEHKDLTWKEYGENFWLKEYGRWGRIFLNNNGVSGRSGDHPRGDRKLIASLPGNHDLGISSGVRKDVRDRFTMFFGDGNRIDMLGNHSFVSVDTVSLTAKALNSPLEREGSEPIWGPPNDFLNDAQKKKAQVLERYLNGKEGRPENPRLDHNVYDLHTPEAKAVKSNAGPGISADIPTVLLTHVPLFRDAGTPCGPLREKHPPSKDLTKVDDSYRDERNAISLHGGYQYQNVLDPEISKELIEKIGNVAHVFSGDDHDYCEVVHRGYTSNGGGVREITVKSMSWAMGVRKPGFLLVSMWNPIDEKGQPLRSSADAGRATIQTKLCLLPDALGTFIRYGQLFALTVLVIGILSYRNKALNKGKGGADTILPLNSSRRGSMELNSLSASSASSSYTDSGANGLASRSGKGRNSPGNGWAMTIKRSEDEDDTLSRPRKRKFSKWFNVLEEFWAGLLQVGLVGFLWYLWLARSF